MSIDISGLDKLVLLHALWSKSSPEYVRVANGVYIPQWDVQEAQKALLGYIYKLNGRKLQVDLCTDVVDFTLYDTHCGSGTSARVVTDMKSDFY